MFLLQKNPNQPSKIPNPPVSELIFKNFKNLLAMTSPPNLQFCFNIFMFILVLQNAK